MRSLPLSISVGLILFIGLSVRPLPGWAQTNTMQVKCVDQTGKPVGGLKVFIQEVTSGKVANADVKADGIARFKDLSNGFYRIIARKQGYETAYYEFVNLSGNANESVTLTFQPGDSQKKIYFEDQALAEQARNLLLEGFDLLQASKWAEGAEKLKASLAINPSNPDAHLYMAVALMQQRQWEQAEPYLVSAAKFSEIGLAIEKTRPPASQNPQLIEAYQKSIAQANEWRQRLPLMKVAAAADDAMRQQDFATAAAKHRELIKMEPNNPDHYYSLAVALGNDRKYDEAIQAIDRALAMKPDDKDYADIKSRLLNNKEAARLEAAKKIVHDADDLYNNGQYAEALRKYEEARPMLPESVQHAVWAAIGRTHAKLNHPDQAIAAYRKAIQLEPTKSDYWKSLAQYYMEQKQYEQMFQTYTDWYSLPSSPTKPDEGLFKLGKDFLGQDKNDLAMSAFNRVLSLNPNHAEVHYELGVNHFYSGDKTKAKEFLTKYLSIGKDQRHIEDAKAILAVMKVAPAKVGPKKPSKKRG